jgi:hypothetical protein
MDIVILDLIAVTPVLFKLADVLAVAHALRGAVAGWPLHGYGAFCADPHKFGVTKVRRRPARPTL